MENKIITLCSSMDFYTEMVKIEEELQTKGFTVCIPHSTLIMKEKNDFEVSHFKGVFSYKQRREFIREHLENIAKSDSILVINNEKNGIPGYIGANVLIEIGIAFYCKKKIYIWNPVAYDASYKDELFCFDAQYINQDLHKIQ